MAYPGLTHASRKPHPMDSEHHAVACGMFGVSWVMEIIDGRDRPSELGVQSAMSMGRQATCF